MAETTGSDTAIKVTTTTPAPLSTQPREVLVLLVNLGSPNAPTTASVRRYLRTFLTDARVIDLSTPLRWLLGGIIIPLFRAKASAKAYQSVWTTAGSPLLTNTAQLTARLQKYLQNLSQEQGTPKISFKVQFAMRYGAPNIADALASAVADSPKLADTLIVLPLYPQQASSSAGSVIEAAYKGMAKWPHFPARTQVISSFFEDSKFCQLWADKVVACKPKAHDKVIFSFHGLPVRHIRASACAGRCLNSQSAASQKADNASANADTPSACPLKMGPRERRCYRASCFYTAHHIAQLAGLNNNDWEVTFQSRLSEGWLKPFTDERVLDLSRLGHKKVLVVCPAFVSDCLETLEEIDIRLKEDFIANGGQKLTLVPSLNADPAWIDFLGQRIKEWNAV